MCRKGQEHTEAENRQRMSAAQDQRTQPIGAERSPVARQFADDLPERIKEGYLLNDLVYFVSEGLVTLWDKDETAVDEVAKTNARANEIKPQDLMDRRYLAEMESSGFFNQLWNDKR